MQCGMKKEHFVYSALKFFPSFLLPLLSTVYQCDRYLSSQGCLGSWLGCQVLPATGAVSILELMVANSGSSSPDVSGTQPPLSDAVANNFYGLLKNSRVTIRVLISQKPMVCCASILKIWYTS